jgi:hypothetical protein
MASGILRGGRCKMHERGGGSAPLLMIFIIIGGHYIMGSGKFTRTVRAIAFRKSAMENNMEVTAVQLVADDFQRLLLMPDLSTSI